MEEFFCLETYEKRPSLSIYHYFACARLQTIFSLWLKKKEGANSPIAFALDAIDQSYFYVFLRIARLIGTKVSRV